MADKMTGESPYAERDPMALDRAGNYYCRHVAAMTRFGLHSKSDIAAELAWRDQRIAELSARLGGGEASYEREVNETLDDVLAWFAGFNGDDYPRKLVESVKSLRAGFHAQPARLAATPEETEQSIKADAYDMCAESLAKAGRLAPGGSVVDAVRGLTATAVGVTEAFEELAQWKDTGPVKIVDGKQYVLVPLDALEAALATHPAPKPADDSVARAAGRAEAMALVMELDAETGLDDYITSHPIGCTGDYGSAWDEKKLRELLKCDDTLLNMMQKAEGQYWDYVGKTDALKHETPKPAEGEGWVLVPKVATDGLLMSMAIRSDHALGCPGYYDQPIFGGEGVGHQRRLESAISQMRQLHEEVVGAGFYKPERDADYAAMLAAAPKKGEG